MALDAQLLLVIPLVALGHLPRMSVAKLSKIALQQYSGDFVEAPGILLVRGAVDGSMQMLCPHSLRPSSALGSQQLPGDMIVNNAVPHKLMEEVWLSHNILETSWK